MFFKLKKLFNKFKEKVRGIKIGWRNSSKSVPLYTNMHIAGLKLHLGSGAINLQGWINVDARSYNHTHIVSDGFELCQFVDGAISEIYMCHVLEHFSFDESEALLKSLKAKLCPGGLLRISVPDFDKLINIYKLSDCDIDNVKFALMGGQDYQYNFHKSLYNLKSLRQLLTKCGYRNVLEWDAISDFGIDLGDWSSANFRTAQGVVPISLNLKATN